MNSIEIVMPRWGTSMEEGTVTAWHVSVGDTVAKGQSIAEVSTDKVDAEIEAPQAGSIAELLVEVGQAVTVGTPVARMATQ